ncbi:multicopper oxidase domain-containing protein [Nonomuraea deserti]|uniref:multicopper oxidase domain-containing protein n=1 Tax=Nonomuraea deserti TaxID=1848322 RepID=UPI001FE6FE20|nr:multicopper oxidase domain-containing protein [Nonomuraea deserti]
MRAADRRTRRSRAREPAAASPAVHDRPAGADGDTSARRRHPTALGRLSTHLVVPEKHAAHFAPRVPRGPRPADHRQVRARVPARPAGRDPLVPRPPHGLHGPTGLPGAGGRSTAAPSTRRRRWATPRLGSTELWTFTSDFHHPVHVHLGHFQVYRRNGRPPALTDAGWKDTVDVRPYEVVEVLVRFTGYRGRYVLHCHNLEHEDMAMMASFDVV